VEATVEADVDSTVEASVESTVDSTIDGAGPYAGRGDVEAGGLVSGVSGGGP
jgi:hypothetical protein